MDAATPRECLLGLRLEAGRLMPGWRWACPEGDLPRTWIEGPPSAVLPLGKADGREVWLAGWAPEAASPPPSEALEALVKDARRVLRRLSASLALERHAPRSERLSEATRLMGAAPDLRSLMQVLTSEAAGLVPLPHWWYNRFDPRTRMSQTLYWTKGLDALFDADLIRDPDPVDGVPLLEQLHYEHTPVYIPRCEDHPHFTPERLARLPHRSLVGLPLVYEGQVAGVLMGGTFGAEGHLSLQEARPQILRSLCEAAALAISRLEARMDLEESEARFRDLFESAPDPILILEEGIILDANPSAEALLGKSLGLLVGAPFCDLCPPEDEGLRTLALERLARVKTGDLQRFEWSCRGREGRVLPCEVSLTSLLRGGHDLVHATVRDLTEQKRAKEEQQKLERQLFQAQKLESLGVLAGGIAHDFNNLLVGVLGYAGLATETLGLLHPAHRYLENIKQAAHKAANLTRQMLAYSGKGEFLVEEINLGIQVEEIIHLLEVSVPKHVLLRNLVDRNLPTITADGAQIQQVIMNLVINAAEAIGNESGVITVATGIQVLDAGYIERVLVGQSLEPGTYVYLEITDTGCGMSPETQARIFEPFFTTKFTGRGLGLSALMGIIHGHGGGIQLYSELGRGTTFKVFFPVQAGGEAAEVATQAQGAWRTTGLGLVVDDDDTTRAVAREMLERMGFEVLEARDGMEAVELVRQLGASLRFVLLDLTMPRMGGEAAFKEMRLLVPQLRVLLSSGYSEHEVNLRLPGRGHLGFIQKPYLPETLEERLRALLNEPE